MDMEVTENVEEVRETDGTVVSPERVNDDAVSFDAFATEVDSWEDDDIKKDLTSGGHKGLPHVRKILSEYVTPEARKFVGNLKADYTRKTQELAKLRRELELEREAISREKLARVDGPAARAAAAKAAESEEGLDPYTLDGLQKLIDIKSAKAMTAAIAEERKALEAERALHRAKKFRDEHPDMMEDSFKNELKTILINRGDLDLEDAYYLIKGRLAQSGAVRAEAEALALRGAQSAQKATARATLVNSSIGRTPLPASTQPPKGLSAAEVYAWYERNAR